MYWVDVEQPELFYEQIQLISYSVMNVPLAAQTLSATTASILKTYYGDDTSGNVLLCDTFFDSLNVRNTSEGEQKNIYDPSFD